MADRTARYAHSPRGAKNHDAPAATESAKAEAEKTAGGANAPHPAAPEKAGEGGKDPGPDAGHDATWGVVAARHAREHGDMLKRHGEEFAATNERHHAEAKAMHKRHHEEMRDAMTATPMTAAREAEAAAGAPKELGAEKSEGKAGGNA